MQIEGPLGLWNFPVLNALIQMSNGGQGEDNSIEVTEVIRDERGRIEAIETIQK